ncbi:MAG: hypothetical protein M1828_005508 [Chrysothrix sp. TS-e1954]|nr:MAG: hypothetical protein M1828_005508 [Chrysothrix sp. TS-e1954]
MHLIITGATGKVGAAALHAMIRNPAIKQISVLSRRPVAQAQASEKCKTTIVEDFAAPLTSQVLAQLKGAHGCVWALGISTSQVGKEEYRQITYDYAMAAAKTFANEVAMQPFNFVYVSGEGATKAPGMFTPRYGRVKGETEEALLALAREEQYKDKLRVYSARPAAVDDKGHQEVEEAMKHRQEGFLKKAEEPVRALMRPMIPSYMSPTVQLGDALVMLASGDGKPLEGSGIEGEGRIVRNAGLRRLAGL